MSDFRGGAGGTTPATTRAASALTRTTNAPISVSGGRDQVALGSVFGPALDAAMPSVTPNSGDAATDAIISAIVAKLRATDNALTGMATTPVNFALFLIDSLSYGSHASSGAGTIGGTVYPAVTLAALGPTWTGSNQGVAGLALNTANNSPYPATYAALYDAVTYPGRKVAILMGGSNDIIGGASAATTEARYAALVATLRGQGWSVFACTITPASQPSAHFIPSSFNTTAATFNTWLRANYAAIGCDGLCDIAGDARIGFAGAELDPTYYTSDPDAGHDNFYIHNIDAGYAVRGAVVANGSVIPAPVTAGGPAGLANIVLGADYRGVCWQDSALTTPAAATNPLGGLQNPAGNLLTQATGGNRPTLQANGIQFDTGKSLAMASPLSLTGDFTVYMLFSRASTKGIVLLGSSTTDQIVVIATDDNIYVVDGTGTSDTTSTPNTVGTNQILRIRRRSGVVYAKGSGFAELALSAGATGTLASNVFGARTYNGGVGAAYTDNSARVQILWAFARDLTSGNGADDRAVRAALVAAGGTDL